MISKTCRPSTLSVAPYDTVITNPIMTGLMCLLEFFVCIVSRNPISFMLFTVISIISLNFLTGLQLVNWTGLLQYYTLFSL